MLNRPYPESRRGHIVRALTLILTLASVFQCQAFSQRDMVLTQFAAGGGLSCDIYVTNQGSSAVTDVTMRFFKQNGTPLTVNSTSGLASSYTFNLPLGATKLIHFSEAGSLSQGYAVIRTPLTASVRASEVFRLESGGAVLFEVGVPQQEPSTLFTFPAEVQLSRQASTGIAVAYPALDDAMAVAQEIVVNLIGSDGALKNSKTIRMEPGASFSAYLHEPVLFPGLDGFVGSVCVTGIRNYSVLALRQDKNGVGSVAVSTGPVLGPFIVPTGPVNETEPNDTRTQAQLLRGNTVVSGIVAAGDGGDYVYFTGKQGDVVSFLATAEGLGGTGWPALSLQKEDGTEVAFNDWSGLMSGPTSFLQAVLPETATYYVRVTNSWGEGAPNVFYQLHARVPTNLGPPPPPPSPLLTTLGPLKAMQGASLKIVVLGINLIDATGVTVNPSDGITAQIVGGDDRHVQVAISISPTAPVDKRQVTVRCGTRQSNSLNFEVIPANQTFQVNGEWTGKSSEGQDVSFTITGGILTRISFGAIPVGGGCQGEVTQLSTGLQIVITNNTLDYQGPYDGVVFGTFHGDKSASGWLRLGSFKGCSGIGIASWTASRQ